MERGIKTEFGYHELGQLAELQYQIEEAMSSNPGDTRQIVGSSYELGTNIYYAYYTEITEVNLSAFVYRLFHEDFSSVVGPGNRLLTNADKSTSAISVQKALH